MWPFKPKKEEYVPLELLEKRLKERNILNDDEALFVSVACTIDENRSNEYTLAIFKENRE